MTLHELLTGRRLAVGSDALVLATVLEARFPQPSELRPDVPRDFDELTARLLRHDRDQRPQTGAEARAAFCALSGTAAPFPTGAKLLAELIQLSLAGQASVSLAAGSPPIVPAINELKDTVELPRGSLRSSK